MVQQSLHHALQNAFSIPLRAFRGRCKPTAPFLSSLSHYASAMGAWPAFSPLSSPPPLALLHRRPPAPLVQIRAGGGAGPAERRTKSDPSSPARPDPRRRDAGFRQCTKRLDATSVTPGFKGKSECIEYMCARIKLHTCIDSVVMGIRKSGQDPRTREKGQRTGSVQVHR
jgi:hypothetical protein